MTTVLDPPMEDVDSTSPSGLEVELQRERPGVLARLIARLGSIPADAWVTFVVVAGCTVFTFAQFHPGLLFSDTTPTGGDMGAHVWGPAYLRDELLPKFRLTGWAPDWYAGFPAYNFYMVLPALAVVLADLVLPYGVALKLVSISGVLTLPLCTWAFGRLAGLKPPYPALMAVAATWFLFDESFTIYGGNIASTMAGEYSFSIALSLAMVYLGLLVRGLRTGRGAPVTAVVLAAAVLCHGIVAIYLVVVSVVFVAVYLSRDGLRFALATLPVGSLLTGFWMIPFVIQHPFMSDMGYERRPIGNAPNGLRDSNWQMLFPKGLAADRLIVAFALVGLIVSVVRRRRLGIALGVCAIGFSIWAIVWPTALLWNARILPWAYFSRYLLAAFGLADAMASVWFALAHRRRIDWPMWAGVLAIATALASWGVTAEMGRLHGFEWHDVAVFATVAAPIVVLAALVRHVHRGVGRLGSPGRWWRGSAPVVGAVAVVGIISMGLQVLPLGTKEVQAYTKADGTESSRWVYHWGPFTSNRRAFSSAWAKWNFKGYEGRDAYGEYRSIMTTMIEVGSAHGCGRAQWEYSDKLGRYGTPMSMMLLPFWTDGCIGSMEGLFFESAGTTPYHFMTRAQVSENSANPHRGLPSARLDLDEGVRRLQILGARYYLAFSDAAKAQADAHPDLVEVAQSGPWRVYLVAGSDLVTPLVNEPVRVSGAEGLDAWRELSVAWFCQPAAEPVLLAADGPDRWASASAVEAASPCETDGDDVTRLVPEPAAAARPLPEVQVSNVRVDDDDLWFDVDRIGVPVLVRVSYFPNWKVSGAEGPFRVSPNFMVVIPTDNQVRLHYGRSGVDLVAMGTTGVGAVGLVALMLVGPRRRRRPEVPTEADELPALPALRGSVQPDPDLVLVVEWDDSQDPIGPAEPDVPDASTPSPVG